MILPLEARLEYLLMVMVMVMVSAVDGLLRSWSLLVVPVREVVMML